MLRPNEAFVLARHTDVNNPTLKSKTEGASDESALQMRCIFREAQHSNSSAIAEESAKNDKTLASARVMSPPVIRRHWSPGNLFISRQIRITLAASRTPRAGMLSSR